MLKKIGIYVDLTATTTSAPLDRGYYFDVNQQIVGNGFDSHVVLEGDILKKISAALYSSPASSVGESKFAIYSVSGAGVPDELLREYTINSPAQSQQGFYRDLIVNEPLSEFIGKKIIPSWGFPVSARFHVVSGTVGVRYWNTSFPEAGGAGVSSSVNMPAFYMEIESPPPEGYVDIVVGSDPIYGDERSCIKDYSGDAPKQGDQIRYAVKSKNGADIVVRDDLTYYGNYVGEEQDEIYLSYWNNDQWNDWIVTVNLKQQSTEITPTTYPEITGNIKVREEVLCSPGVYESPEGDVTVVSYDWKIDDESIDVDQQQITLADDSYGKIVSCDVTVTDGVNTATFTAVAFMPVDGLSPQVAVAPLPSNPKVGVPININISIDAVPSPTVIFIEWMIDGVVAGRGYSYTPKQRDAGKLIQASISVENGLEPDFYYETENVGPIEGGDVPPSNWTMAKSIKAKAITAKAITARGLNDGSN